MIGFTRMRQQTEVRNSVVRSYVEVLKRVATSYNYKRNGQAKEDFDNGHNQRRKRRNLKIDLTTSDKKIPRSNNKSEHVCFLKLM